MANAAPQAGSTRIFSSSVSAWAAYPGQQRSPSEGSPGNLRKRHQLPSCQGSIQALSSFGFQGNHRHIIPAHFSKALNHST
ncbi:hypothetical protein E2320_012587 [Naja naja]|nr:hypothetical protein E2320_012587 [Naja naja]